LVSVRFHSARVLSSKPAARAAASAAVTAWRFAVSVVANSARASRRVRRVAARSRAAAILVSASARIFASMFAKSGAVMSSIVVAYDAVSGNAPGLLRELVLLVLSIFAIWHTTRTLRAIVRSSGGASY